MEIKENLLKLRSEIPEKVKLVAVSKTKPVETLMEAYNAGQRIFGENKAQELVEKQAKMPADVRWHFIGHLQTNKVKMLVPVVSMIEAVDSLKLLRNIDKEARKIKRRVPCLLQFHIAEEDTKFGLDVAEADAMLQKVNLSEMTGVQIAGVMGMATYTDDVQQVNREFAHLHQIFDEIKTKYFPNEDSFCEISMGMSGDYKIAIAQGSTMVRIGSLIFGERNYQ
ncbi:MAG: YggS family pyridoxal phosphate-dependent enzyme [Bacteroidales bacterium]|jgi:pyridoxal phosphate enzyme (YggS family)|nr:YggS family pyridoxal phosphate-dependent enzyme [Bacteroidales bacterium]NCU34969.1 YggS family pyridoxal phosphate-dependent enzyme [Candidatus Falkowbacteria bacterium]MDD2632457.1 YggS family pyridoxal phosphate-dependent enzyme [Bacteroidales bacterium]MDD3131402.1 YggS family pyridoxal phosphate-dependent enzyme [Bacteroidales bacterium]MDD3525406.1 YggS family pyridoxal phosphate-dependent enzyme [Bacteroidales bacterium]